MSKSAIKWVAAAGLTLALAVPPAFTPAFAAGSDEPSPPPPSSKSAPKDTKKSKKKQSNADDPAFIQGYRAAYTTIYDGHAGRRFGNGIGVLAVAQCRAGFLHGAEPGLIDELKKSTGR